MAYTTGKTFKELDKNTRSFQFRNSKGEFPSTLVLGFWNGTMTLKMHPALPEGKRSQEKVFDYETYVMSVLTAEAATALIEAIDTEIQPGEAFDDIGVDCGQSYIEISMYSNIDGVEEEGIYLNLYNKLDEHGNPREIISYKFGGRNYFKNFKNKQGKEMSTIKTKFPTEFIMFVKFLNNGLEAMTNAIAHSLRNANKYDDNKNFNNTVKIMEKLGISDISGNNGGGYNKGGSNSFFNKFGNNNNSNSGNDNFNYNTEYSSLDGGDRVDLDMD